MNDFIDILRINRNIEKKCKCENRQFIVDPQNRTEYCESCGAQIVPYEAIYDLALHYERLNEQLNRLYEQRKKIANYKPHMIVFRDLERQYRGNKMLFCCPHCNRGFYFEELKGWINSELEKKWRERDE